MLAHRMGLDMSFLGLPLVLMEGALLLILKQA